MAQLLDYGQKSIRKYGLSNGVRHLRNRGYSFPLAYYCVFKTYPIF